MNQMHDFHHFRLFVAPIFTILKKQRVKKAIRRMEDEGLLQGSRERRPGFGPRLLRIADDFPAREQLQALIDAVPAVWPDLGERMDLAFQSVPEKTKVYFRRRGLID